MMQFGTSPKKPADNNAATVDNEIGDKGDGESMNYFYSCPH